MGSAGVGGTRSVAHGGSGGRGGVGVSGGSAGRGGTTSSGGSSGSAGGYAGATAAGEGGVANTGEGGTESTGEGGTGAFASGDGYPQVPPPACSAGADYVCDGDRRIDCAAPDEVIAFDPARDMRCPVCAAPPAGSRTCERSRSEYRDFLAAIVSATCTNYCEEDSDCAAWEITNACGSVALSLTGLLDEEPIGFAEDFAATRCEPCGNVPQRITLRRVGSPTLQGDPSSAGLLDSYGPRCVNRQCVLQPL
jgi:hypothetical protein